MVWKFCGKAFCGIYFETMQKMCLSTKFPHQEIKWNYGILRSAYFTNNKVYYESISNIFLPCQAYFWKDLPILFVLFSILYLKLMPNLFDIISRQFSFSAKYWAKSFPVKRPYSFLFFFKFLTNLYISSS